MEVYFVMHKGIWPVGACSIVVARNIFHARELMSELLAERGIKDEEPVFTRVNTDEPRAIMILDGDY